jgi:hypothetical protein
MNSRNAFGEAPNRVHNNVYTQFFNDNKVDLKGVCSEKEWMHILSQHQNPCGIQQR